MNILLTILAVIISFGIIIFIHELGHFLAAKLSGVKVNEFALGMGPTLLRHKGKETTYSLRAFPIGGFCSMEGEDEESESEGAFNKAPLGNRMLIVVAGAVMNFLLGFVLLAILITSQGVIASKTVSSFYEDAQTQQSGLEVGDEIYSINGRRLYIADDIFYEMARVKDGKADLVVIRDGEKTQLKDFQFGTYVDEDGNSQIVVDFYVEPIKLTVGSVLSESLKNTFSVIRLVCVSVVDLITGNVALNQLSGPIGIVSVIGEAVSYGIESLLNLIAFISINLGVMNLLPLPALDGGRFVLLLVEGITHKKLSAKYEAIINVAGFVLLMALMLFVSYNDITRLFK